MTSLLLLQFILAILLPDAQKCPEVQTLAHSLTCNVLRDKCCKIPTGEPAFWLLQAGKEPILHHLALIVLQAQYRHSKYGSLHLLLLPFKVGLVPPLISRCLSAKNYFCILLDNARLLCYRTSNSVTECFLGCAL